MIRAISLLLFTSSLLAASNLDSLLSVQRIRAGVRADTLFSALDRATESERAEAEFLLAYLPLADLAYMTGENILENVRLAEEARAEFSWGAQLTDELYQHFVLPHRVSQEPFVHWRDPFHHILAPRVQHLTMTEAALEVNHWCHEVATYQPSDSRDQDPLTTIRAGLGRCEEEMILAICALRSVGIPARQCYTPFWPHMDDNHAWVEVWADGKWHYFGACEPDVALNQAWFTNAAARAMLVVSTAYGDYHGSEPVLKRYGASTLINSTAVYGTARELNVTLLDAQGQPAAKQKIFFNLYNYGCILPALALDTDEHGQVKLVCGPGDWFVTAGASPPVDGGTKGGAALFTHVKSSDTNVTLRLGKTKDLREIQFADYAPPPAAPAKEGNKADSLFACRLTIEDSIRDSRMWSTWIRENHLDTVAAHGSAIFVSRPDSEWVYQQTDSLLPNSSQQQLLEIMRKARGNWGNLWKFVFGTYPGGDKSTTWDSHQELRFVVLTTLSEKDRRDFSCAELDHYLDSTFGAMYQVNRNTSTGRWDAVTDSAKFLDYVLCPRLSYEPSRQSRFQLYSWLFFRPNKDIPLTDDFLRTWLLWNITVEDPKDRLGPPLTPAECLLLRRGGQDDLERLYLGFMRVNGVPARFNPATMKPEIWQNDAWQMVDLKKPETKNQKLKTPRAGKLMMTLPPNLDLGGGGVDSARYNRSWGVQIWEKDHFSDLDLGYLEPFNTLEWPRDLPAGLYCLTTGIRRSDGSAPVSFTWFEIKPGKTTKVELNFPDASSAAKKSTENFEGSRQE